MEKYEEGWKKRMYLISGRVGEGVGVLSTMPFNHEHVHVRAFQFAPVNSSDINFNIRDMWSGIFHCLNIIPSHARYFKFNQSLSVKKARY